jgi:hypothetical protein
MLHERSMAVCSHFTIAADALPTSRLLEVSQCCPPHGTGRFAASSRPAPTRCRRPAPSQMLEVSLPSRQKGAHRLEALFPGSRRRADAFCLAPGVLRLILHLELLHRRCGHSPVPSRGLEAGKPAVLQPAFDRAGIDPQEQRRRWRSSCPRQGLRLSHAVLRCVRWLVAGA